MRKIYLTIAFVILCASAFAEKEKELPVRCTGDSVTYVREENTIYGKGNVEIGYQDNYIRADSIKVNIKTKEAEADGRVIVSDGTNVFTGDRVYYNFDTGKGEVDGIGTRLDPWFAIGKHGERIKGKPYYIKNGYITTCDYDVPHYRIKARDIYIYPEDKVIAKQIVVYVKNVPVFYWPYYKKSLKDERSPWTIIPGYDNKFGKFLLVGYTMWFENFFGGVFEPTLRLDYYEKRGFATGFNAGYTYKDKALSLMRAYYINDKEYVNESGQKKQKQRGRFSIDYIQKIASDIRGIVDLNWQSDPTIIQEFYRDEFEDEIQTENYINIAKTATWYQLSLMVKKRFHNFFTDLERLPELSFNILECRVGKTNLLYVGNASTGYLSQRFSKQSGGDDYSAGRFDTYHQLSYPKKFFGWLNVVPSVGTRQTFWNKRAQKETATTSTTQVTPTPSGAATGTTTSTTTTSTGTSTTTTETTTVVDPVNTTITKEVTTVTKKELDKPTWRSVYRTGVEFTTKIARVFYVYSDFWEIEQLRHVIEPRAGYVYQHEPTVKSEDLLNFGDLEEKQNYFPLGLRNKLQTKRNKMAWDLVDFWFGSSYYPEKYEEPGVDKEKRHFSHITSKLEIRPYEWLAMDMNADFDQYDMQVDTYNADIAYFKDDKFSFGLGYRYMLNSDKLWTSEINYRINSDWAIRLQHRFEFDTGQLQEQEYIVVRDLHCWNLAFTFRRYSNIDETVCFVVLFPKAYPNIPFTFGTTYFGRDDTNKVTFGSYEY